MEDKIASRQIDGKTAMFVLFILHVGSLGAFGAGLGLRPGGWLSWLLAFIFFLPISQLWVYLGKKSSGMNLFSALEQGFGRKLSQILGFLYVGFFLLLAARLLFFHGAMLQMLVLPYTPFALNLLLLFGLSAYLAKSGLQAVGKWCVLLAGIFLFATVLFFILATPIMEVYRVLPLVLSGGQGVLEGAVHFFLQTLGNAVIMLALLGNGTENASQRKLFFVATAFAVLFFSLSFLREVSILGQAGAQSALYPSYKAAGLIRIGSTGARVEVFVLLLDMVMGLTKVALCVMAGARGMAHIFGGAKENALILSLSFFALGLSVLLFSSIRSLLDFTGIYLCLAPVFQVILPAILCVALAIRGKRGREGKRKI